MADLGFNFDSDSVEDSPSYSLIPPGDYTAVIARTEIKSTKKGDGKYISVMVEIVDQVCNGRVLWDNINFDNPNPTAMKIAQQTLKQICTALGIKKMRDTAEMEGKPLVVTIKSRKSSYNGEEENFVRAYKPSGGTSEPVVRSTAQPQQEKAPWD